MTHERGESLVKGIQKKFLTWVEEHPDLEHLGPKAFNKVRKQVFNATWNGFRLGVIGINDEDFEQGRTLWKDFFDWLMEVEEVSTLAPDLRFEVQRVCFFITLLSFRVGALVSGGEGE